MKEQISKLICNELAYRNCSACRKLRDDCKYCRPTMSHWKLSEDTADQLADKIMLIINKRDKEAHESNFQHRQLCDLDP